MAEEIVPQCVDCGVCCFSELPEYVRVFGVDLERMDERATGHTHFLGNRLFMKMDGGHCTALVLDPGALTYTCSIYPMRPDVCRSLERGLSMCRADRHEKGARPLLAIEALLAHRRG